MPLYIFSAATDHDDPQVVVVPDVKPRYADAAGTPPWPLDDTSADDRLRTHQLEIAERLRAVRAFCLRIRAGGGSGCGGGAQSGREARPSADGLGTTTRFEFLLAQVEPVPAGAGWSVDVVGGDAGLERIWCAGTGSSGDPEPAPKLDDVDPEFGDIDLKWADS